MSKLLIETTGDFMLMDNSTGAEIHWNRPTVCPRSNFIGARTAMGQIKVLSNELSEDATDEEFGAFLLDSKNDKELAVSAFISKFGPQPIEVEVVAPAKK